MKQAIVLFAHGARDPQWADPLRRVQSHVRRQRPDSVVELAFLELMAPDLSGCVAALVAQGVFSITIIPMFIAQNGHLKRDIPALLEALRGRYPQVRLHQAGAVGEADNVIEAMAGYAAGFIE